MLCGPRNNLGQRPSIQHASRVGNTRRFVSVNIGVTRDTRGACLILAIDAIVSRSRSIVAYFLLACNCVYCVAMQPHPHPASADSAAPASPRSPGGHSLADIEMQIAQLKARARVAQSTAAYTHSHTLSSVDGDGRSIR